MHSEIMTEETPLSPQIERRPNLSSCGQAWNVCQFLRALQNVYSKPETTTETNDMSTV